jgi:predicted DNA-binding transcriptional regulator AlpA
MTKQQSLSVNERFPRTRVTKATNGRGASRPPSYLGRKELAWEFSCSESTIDVLVRTGVIPPPIKLTPGCVRWSWMAVQEWLANLGADADDGDPYMAGALNATS